MKNENSMCLCHGIRQQSYSENDGGNRIKQLHMKDVEVEVVDTSTARGSQADIIVSSHSFCEQLSDMGVAMIEVVNYTDANYIKEQLQKILSAQ